MAAGMPEVRAQEPVTASRACPERRALGLARPTDRDRRSRGWAGSLNPTGGLASPLDISSGSALAVSARVGCAQIGSTVTLCGGWTTLPRSTDDGNPASRSALRTCSVTDGRGSGCRGAPSSATSVTRSPCVALCQWRVATFPPGADAPAKGVSWRRPTAGFTWSVARVNDTPGPRLSPPRSPGRGSRCWPARRAASCSDGDGRGWRPRPTFGTGGVVFTDITGGPAIRLRTSSIRSPFRRTAGSSRRESALSDPSTSMRAPFLPTRYDVDGTLDPTFGTNGVVSDVGPAEQHEPPGGRERRLKQLANNTNAALPCDPA